MTTGVAAGLEAATVATKAQEALPLDKKPDVAAKKADDTAAAEAPKIATKA